MTDEFYVIIISVIFSVFCIISLLYHNYSQRQFLKETVPVAHQKLYAGILQIQIESKELK